MTGDEPLVIGLDVGTSGVRVIAATTDGAVVARASVSHTTQRPFSGAVEQDPEAWWSGVLGCLEQVGDAVDLGRVSGLAISSTSGTVCLLDATDDPVRPAIVYSDARAGAQAVTLSEVRPFDQPVRETDALAKLLWVRDHEPDAWADVVSTRSPVGFIGARLAGRLLPFDHTQATKFGYDPVVGTWPVARLSLIGLDSLSDTPVVEPGTAIGAVSGRSADATGLPIGTTVVAGATDGVSGFIACSPRLREGCTIAGTTVVWKTLADAPVEEAGGVYSHKGPRGSWLPGAASNSGGGIIEEWFPGRDPTDLGTRLKVPSDGIVYPLTGRGERFPFRDPDAVSFRMLPDGADKAALFAACLEGVAFVERWGYERIAGRGLVDLDLGIVSAGGATRSEAWLRIRASVLGTQIRVPAEASSAYGAALLAISGIGHRDPIEIAASRVRFEHTIDPVPDWIDAYDDRYARFRAAASDRGWT